MAPESIHTTDHRHFVSGNLTLKDSTAESFKQNRPLLSTKIWPNFHLLVIFTYCVNDNLSRNLISSEKSFAHDFWESETPTKQVYRV